MKLEELHVLTLIHNKGKYLHKDEVKKLSSKEILKSFEKEKLISKHGNWIVLSSKGMELLRTITKLLTFIN